MHTLPTAASPSRTSLTLLLGLGADAVESVIELGELGLLARKLRPKPYSDTVSAAGALGGEAQDRRRVIGCSASNGS